MALAVDQHEFISELKNLAIELGRAPKRKEAADAIPRFWAKLELFGNRFEVALQAAGLDKAERASKKITNEIFTRSIEKHLEAYQPRAYAPPGPFPSACILSDIHWPFASYRVIAAFIEHIKKAQPEWVIINGDAWDMYSHSKYPRSHNIFTPREEERLSRENNEKFWKDVKLVCPNAKLVQMMGNHDVRPMKRILEEYPEAEDWVSERLNRLFTFDGVKTIMDPTEELFLNEKTIVFHGYRSKLGDHRDYTLLNCINGHTHVGGVVWRQLRNEVIFEANSGIAGDPMAKGLTYRPQKITHWTPGFLAMDALGPRFIPA